MIVDQEGFRNPTGNVIDKDPMGFSTENVRSLIEDYRRAEVVLRAFRWDYFRPGQRVCVNAERYEGPGVVVADSQCPITQIPVLLPNGNVWYYDMTDVTPRTD